MSITQAGGVSNDQAPPNRSAAKAMVGEYVAGTMVGFRLHSRIVFMWMIPSTYQRRGF
jgi:hypothetical protein